MLLDRSVHPDVKLLSFRNFQVLANFDKLPRSSANSFVVSTPHDFWKQKKPEARLTRYLRNLLPNSLKVIPYSVFGKP